MSPYLSPFTDRLPLLEFLLFFKLEVNFEAAGDEDIFWSFLELNKILPIDPVLLIIVVMLELAGDEE